MSEEAKASEPQQKADHQNQSWENMESFEEDIFDPLRSLETSRENSDDSITSSSSSDMVEDASSSSSSNMVEDASSSSSSSSSSGLSNGPLYELSELMEHLPLRRGLSKHYQGKSQSFTSLADANSLEDLPKRVIPNNYKKKIKACKSFGGGLDHGNDRVLYIRKPTISKKTSRGSSFLFFSNLGASTRASIPLHRNKC